MATIKKVLVPFDNNLRSIAALDYAAMFASGIGATITALHLADPKDFHSLTQFKNELADLVNDVNDLKQSNELTQKLLKWTDVSKCHLTGILHKNFGTAKPTGHLGSSILKKAETVCLLESNEQDKKFTDVSFPYTRSFNIDSFSFYIDENGLPMISDKNKLPF